MTKQYSNGWTEALNKLRAENAELRADNKGLLEACRLALPTLQQIRIDSPDNIAAALNIKAIREAIARSEGAKNRTDRGAMPYRSEAGGRP